jgi:hypothetical protein
MVGERLIPSSRTTSDREHRRLAPVGKAVALSEAAMEVSTAAARCRVEENNMRICMAILGKTLATVLALTAFATAASAATLDSTLLYAGPSIAHICTVTNVGDKTIGSVQIDFFDLPGNLLGTTLCGAVTPGATCYTNDMDGLGWARCRVTIKGGSKTDIRGGFMLNNSAFVAVPLY